MEEGYLALEVGDLSLVYHKKAEKDIKLTVEFEIQKGYDVFKWKQNNEGKFTTEQFTPMLRENEGLNNTEAANYIYGFNELFLRTNYIELNSEVLNSLVNASLVVKILTPNENAAAAAAAAAAPAKGGKGAPAPVAAAPVNPFDTVAEFQIPFGALIQIRGSTVAFDGVFSQFFDFAPDLPNPIFSPLIDIDQCTFNFKLYGDNCLAEYVLGSKMLSWKGALMQSPPHTWALHAPDVLDPKAKVQPNAAELRTKYLENIQKHLATQSKVANYTLVVGGFSSEAANEGTPEGEENTINQIQQILSKLELSNGRIEFAQTDAEQIPPEEDIRVRGDLWKVLWDRSTYIFLHRSQIKNLVNLIENEPDHAFLPLTVKKIPTPEAVANEGGELFATSVVDISSIVAPGKANFTMKASLRGDLMDSDPATFEIEFTASSPLVPKAPLEQFKNKNNSKAVTASSTSLSTKKIEVVSTNSSNRDILQELRDEISSTIERIAQEYVAIYPNTINNTPLLNEKNNIPNKPSSPANSATSNSQSNNFMNPSNHELEERKEKFLSFLVNNGIFLELQESLRIKVQLLIKDHYSRRGRALGKSEVMKSVDANGAGGGGSVVSFSDQTSNNAGAAGGSSDAAADQVTLVQSILSELYVFLMKECNLILNSLFKSTIIQKDVNDIENPAAINDEKENDLQVFHRLYRQANDALVDGKYTLAENIFMERLSLIDHSVSLGSNSQYVHIAYSQYANYLLKRAATAIYNANGAGPGAGGVSPTSVVAGEGNGAVAQSNGDMETYNLLIRKAREALTIAHTSEPNNWETTLLLASVLIQLDQLELAEEVLLEVISSQLAAIPSKEVEFSLTTFNDFSGYDSDALFPIHPKAYAIIAAYLYLQGKTLECRKALLLANRSYAEGEFPGKTSIAAHGKPRRTLVLILSETSLYLSQLGIYKLAEICLLLAKDSEASCTDKAQARNKPAVTPPFIKVLLKLADAETAWSTNPLITDYDAIELAKDAFYVADSPKDRVLSKLTEAKGYNKLRNDPENLLNAYLTAIQEAIASIPLETMISEQIIPLESFVLIGKYLVYSGFYLESINILLYASSIYNSAILAYLLGLSYLRLDRFDEAEEVFLEANLLDNRHADVWSYLAIIAVHKGYHRIPEAEQCLYQTLRLGQSDPIILRELATAFMSIDKLQTAEELVRRTIAIEVNNSINSKPSSYTRKLLADILAGQNMAAKAIDEYKQLLMDETIDFPQKLAVAEKCSNLLISLGRDEEVQSLQQIMENMRLDQELAAYDNASGMENDYEANQ